MRADGIWKPNFEMAGDMDLVFGMAGIIWLIFLIKNVADGVIDLSAGKDSADIGYLWQMSRF